MALRSVAGKLMSLLPLRRAPPRFTDPELQKAHEYERRIIRNSALIGVTSFGAFAFLVKRCVDSIGELNDAMVKTGEMLLIHDKICELDNVEDEAAKAKALRDLIQRVVDLGEGEKVLPLLEEAVKMMEQEAKDADN